MGTFSSKLDISGPAVRRVAGSVDVDGVPQDEILLVVPGEGETFKARVYGSGADLGDVSVTSTTGDWFAFFPNIDAIEVSLEVDTLGQPVWRGPLFSLESRLAGFTAVDDIDEATATAVQALAAAVAADQKATQALNGGGGGGGPITISGVTGTNFTLDQIYARDKRVGVPVTQIEGLSDVGRSNSFRDLDDVPSFPVMVNGKIQAANLPTDGTFDRPIRQNADGTFPARNTVSSDPTRRIYYDQTYNLATFPATGPNPDTAYLPDPANGIPGDAIFRHGAP